MSVCLFVCVPCVCVRERDTQIRRATAVMICLVQFVAPVQVLTRARDKILSCCFTLALYSLTHSLNTFTVVVPVLVPSEMVRRDWSSSVSTQQQQYRHVVCSLFRSLSTRQSSVQLPCLSPDTSCILCLSMASPIR